MTEYGVVRMDHFGWLYATNTNEGLAELGWNLASNWNWDTFLTNLDGSHVTVTVANSGNGKASVRYHVVYTARPPSATTWSTPTAKPTSSTMTTSRWTAPTCSSPSSPKPPTLISTDNRLPI